MAAFQASPPKRNLKSLSGPTSWFWKNVTSLVALPYSQSKPSTPPMPEKLPLRMLSRNVENSEKSSTDRPESPPALGSPWRRDLNAYAQHSALMIATLPRATGGVPRVGGWVRVRCSALPERAQVRNT